MVEGSYNYVHILWRSIRVCQCECQCDGIDFISDTAVNDPLADPFALPVRWQHAMTRIVNMMQTGVVKTTDLPPGPASALGIERYSRELCAANPQSNLGIMYGLTSVATCVAAQGAYVLKAPVAGGGYLEVPAIQHFIGIAPSGWRKSTALNLARGPLRRALAKGEHARRMQVPLERKGAEQQAEAQASVGGKELPRAQFVEVYNGGFCATTLVKDPTVEGLRNMLVHNGGVAAVMAGEADVFQNLRQYNPDGASLTFFLDGWSQEDVQTVRAGQGLLAMDEAALLMAVLFQSDVFADVTSGGRVGPTTGGDSFAQRGMFGRMWVTEAESTDGWAEIAAEYPDDAVWDQHLGVRGMENRWGEITPLGVALDGYSDALEQLVIDSNRYRMFKALRHSWLLGFGKYGNDFKVPEIDQEPQIEIRLDKDGLVAYARLQRMYNAIMDAVSDMDPDMQSLWEPLATRITQHVLREALTVSLAAGRRYVSGEIITDCAIRILPWRMAMSTKALMRRQTERVDDVIAQSMTENTQQTDLSTDAKILAIMHRLSNDEPKQRGLGWTRGDIGRRVASTISSRSRKGVAARAGRALDLMAETPGSGITRIEAGVDAINRPVFRYLLDTYAKAEQPKGP